MRIKSLSIIASFLVFSLAITSCLDSDNNYELSSDNLITAFSLDTIYGVTYKFTIDQIKGQIYNVDSVAYGADTIINKILINTFTTNGYVTAGPDNTEPFSRDTLFDYTDSLDLSNTMEEPLKIRVRSYDGLYIKQYSIEVRIHKTDPDSLVWGDTPYVKPFFKDADVGESKAVLFKDEIFVFATGTQVTVYPETKQWQRTNITTPDNIAIKVSSIINLNDTLYAAGDGDGKIYFSINSVEWTHATSTWGEGTDPVSVENLLTTFKSGNGEYICTGIALLFTFYFTFIEQSVY
ncbi:MAG: DUF6242 domain-containing protein [Mediterranea sp.]|jgi:hypothetical protein|nr:DUF6242 domain-containing protein [Mediterranea sp.]